MSTKDPRELLEGCGHDPDEIEIDPDPVEDIGPEDVDIVDVFGQSDTSLIPWWSDDDFRTLAEMCARLRMRPDDLALVLYSESGLKPTASNPGGAAGLNQLMPFNFSRVGFTGSRDDYLALPISEQLGYVERYFTTLPWTQGGNAYESPGRIYQANFAPGTMHGSEGEDTVLYSKKRECTGDAEDFKDAYCANRSLDKAGKGSITLGDLTSYMNSNVNAKTYRDAVTRMTQLGLIGGGGAGVPAKGRSRGAIVVPLMLGLALAGSLAYVAARVATGRSPLPRFGRAA